MVSILTSSSVPLVLLSLLFCFCCSSPSSFSSAQQKEIIIDNFNKPYDSVRLPRDLPSSQRNFPQSDTVYIFENNDIGVLEIERISNSASSNDVHLLFRNNKIGAVIITDHIAAFFVSIKFENNQLGAFKSMHSWRFYTANFSFSNNLIDADEFLFPKLDNSDKNLTQFFDTQWHRVEPLTHQVELSADLSDTSSVYPSIKQTMYVVGNTIVRKNLDTVARHEDPQKYFPWGPLGIGYRDYTETENLRNLIVENNNISLVEFNNPDEQDFRDDGDYFRRRNSAIEIFLLDFFRAEYISISKNTIVISSGNHSNGIRLVYRKLSIHNFEQTSLGLPPLRFFIDENDIFIRGTTYPDLPSSMIAAGSTKTPHLKNSFSIIVENPSRTLIHSDSTIGHIDTFAIRNNNIRMRSLEFIDLVTGSLIENTYGIMVLWDSWGGIASNTRIQSLDNYLLESNIISVRAMRGVLAVELEWPSPGVESQSFNVWRFDNNSIMLHGSDTPGASLGRSRGLYIATRHLVNGNLFSVSNNSIQSLPISEDGDARTGRGAMTDFFPIQIETGELRDEKGEQKFWRLGLRNITRVRIDDNKINAHTSGTIVGILFAGIDNRNVTNITVSNNFFNLSVTAYVIKQNHGELGKAIDAIRFVHYPAIEESMGWLEIANNNITIVHLIEDKTATFEDMTQTIGIRVFGIATPEQETLLSDFNYTRKWVRNPNAVRDSISQNVRGIRLRHNSVVMQTEVTDNIQSLATCYGFILFENYLYTGEYDVSSNYCQLKQWARPSRALGATGFVLAFSSHTEDLGRVLFENNTVDATDVVAAPERRLGKFDDVSFLRVMYLPSSVDFERLFMPNFELLLYIPAAVVFSAHTLLVRNNSFIVADTSEKQDQILKTTFVEFLAGYLIRFQHVIIADNYFENRRISGHSIENAGTANSYDQSAFLQVRSLKENIPIPGAIKAFITSYEAYFSVEKTFSLIRNTIISTNQIIPVFDVQYVNQYLPGSTFHVSIGQPVYLNNELTGYKDVEIGKVLNYSSIPTVDRAKNYSVIEQGRPQWYRDLVERLEEEAWNYSASVEEMILQATLEDENRANSSTNNHQNNNNNRRTSIFESSYGTTNSNPFSLFGRSSGENSGENQNNVSQICEMHLRRGIRRHGFYSIGNRVEMKDTRSIPKSSTHQQAAPIFNFAFANISFNGSFCSSFDNFSIESHARSNSDRAPILFQVATAPGAQTTTQSSAVHFTDFIFDRSLIEFICPSSISHLRFYYCASFSEASPLPSVAASNHLVRRLATPASIYFSNSTLRYSRVFGQQQQRGGHFPGVSFPWLGVGTVLIKSSGDRQLQQPWLPSSYQIAASLFAENRTKYDADILAVGTSSIKSAMILQNSVFIFSGANVQVGFGDTFSLLPISITVNSTRSLFVIDAPLKIRVLGTNEAKGTLPLVTMTVDSGLVSSSQTIQNELLRTNNIPMSPVVASRLSPSVLPQSYRFFTWEETEIITVSPSDATSSSSTTTIFQQEDFSLVHLTSTDDQLRYFDNAQSPLPVFDSSILNFWQSSSSFAAHVHCYAFNAYQERKTSSAFDTLGGTTSNGVGGESFFQPCPYSPTRTKSETVSVVPVCSVFSLDFAGSLLTANAVVKAQFVKVKFVLVTRSALGGSSFDPNAASGDSFTTLRIGLANLTGDVFVDGYGLDENDFGGPVAMTTTAAPDTSNNNNNIPHEGKDLLDFSKVSKIFTSSDSSVAEVVTGRVAAPRVLEVILKFNVRLNTKNDHTFSVLVNPSVFSCRQGLQTITSNEVDPVTNQIVKRVTRINPDTVLNPNQDVVTGWYRASVVVRRRSTALPSGVEEAAATAGAVGAALGAFASPMVGTSLGKAGATQAFADCSFSMTEELMWIESPFGFNIGDEWGGYRRGALVGNNLLIVIICLLLSIIALVRVSASHRKHQKWMKKHKEEVMRHKSVLKSDDSPELERHASLRQLKQLKVEKRSKEPAVLSFRDGLYFAKLPSTLFIPKAILTQGTVSSAVSLIVSGRNNNDRVLGAFFLMIEILWFVWCAKCIFVDLPRTRHWLLYQDRPRETRRFWGESDPNEARGDAEKSTKIIFSDCIECRPALKQMKVAEETKKRNKLLMKQLQTIMKEKKKKREIDRKQQDDERRRQEVDDRRKKLLEKTGITPEQSQSVSLANTPVTVTPTGRSPTTQDVTNNKPSFEFYNNNNKNKNTNLDGLPHHKSELLLDLDPSSVSTPADQKQQGYDESFGTFIDPLAGATTAGNLPRRNPMIRRSIFNKAKIFFDRILLHPYGDWMTVKPKDEDEGDPNVNENQKDGTTTNNFLTPKRSSSLRRKRTKSGNLKRSNNNNYNNISGNDLEIIVTAPSNLTKAQLDLHKKEEETQKRIEERRQKKFVKFDPTFLPRSSDVYVQNSGAAYYWCLMDDGINFTIAICSGLQTAFDDCSALLMIVSAINLIPLVFILMKWPFSDRASNIFALIAASLLVMMSFVSGIGDVFRGVEVIDTIVASLNVAMGYFGMFKSGFDVMILGLTFESWALLPFLAAVHLFAHRSSPLRRFLGRFFSKEERDRRKFENEEDAKRKQRQRQERLRRGSNSNTVIEDDDEFFFGGQRNNNNNDDDQEMLLDPSLNALIRSAMKSNKNGRKAGENTSDYELALLRSVGQESLARTPNARSAVSSCWGIGESTTNSYDANNQALAPRNPAVAASSGSSPPLLVGEATHQKSSLDPLITPSTTLKSKSGGKTVTINDDEHKHRPPRLSRTVLDQFKTPPESSSVLLSGGKGTATVPKKNKLLDAVSSSGLVTSIAADENKINKKNPSSLSMSRTHQKPTSSRIANKFPTINEVDL